ncbi:hypothetical protein quinque_006650 [Culex quinquefasciatus]
MGNLRLAVLAILLAHCLVTLAQQEVIVAIDEPGKTQYHEANFNTSAYQFGYEVGPNGQFHHETRGPDGVTYGCYGYIDPNGLLRVTHYVADTHGYRVVEPNHPVEIFMDAPSQYSNAITDEDPKVRHRGQVVPWKDLYLPRGCGMYPGGLRPDGPPVTPPPQNPAGRIRDLEVRTKARAREEMVKLKGRTKDNHRDLDTSTEDNIKAPIKAQLVLVDTKANTRAVTKALPVNMVGNIRAVMKDL